MSYHSAMFWIIGLFALLFGLFQGWRFWQQQRMEHFLANTTFPEAWRIYLNQTLHYPKLNPDERHRVEQRILHFLYLKSFRGVDLEPTDEMRLIIAFFASLMILNKPGDWYEGFSTVLLYRHGFVAPHLENDGGIVTNGAFELDGQASRDTVALSWEDVRREAYTPQPSNLVIHEFAHILDFADGIADGTPSMPQEDLEHLYEAYENYRAQVLHGYIGAHFECFEPYAAEHEAEFFAIASERFYQTPALLFQNQPKLYAILERFYGTDPRKWHIDTDDFES